MSNNRSSFRALVAILLIPLSGMLACASGQPKDTRPRINPADTSSIANGGGGKSIENLLEGRFPGVTVSQGSSGGLQIRIRGGTNSFYSGEEPLYVLDDTPLPPGTGGIVMVNPYDIQRIEVLKNPADVAIYGMRGSNGVIKITTKKRGGR